MMWIAQHMTIWKSAMLLILPLMLWGAPAGAKPRTWLAMFGGSVAAIFVPFNYLVYALIDLLSGAVVLSRPAGEAQKAIGTLFAGMAICSIGFWFGGARQPGAFAEFLALLGWLQTIILISWGSHDCFRYYFRRDDARWRVSASDEGRVQ